MTAFREATDDDRAFVVSGWSASLRMTRDVPLIAMADWAGLMRPVIEKAMARPRARTIVAHLSVLVGFICFEPAYVLYVYVAQPYRRSGVARGLFEAAGIDPAAPFEYACRTKASWELRGKVPAAKYDPYRARFAERETT